MSLEKSWSISAQNIIVLPWIRHASRIWISINSKGGRLCFAVWRSVFFILADIPDAGIGDRHFRFRASRKVPWTDLRLSDWNQGKGT